MYVRACFMVVSIANSVSRAVRSDCFGNLTTLHIIISSSVGIGNQVLP